ncbi:MAG TPA: hypothetical protein PLT00_13705 [Verrucomicrobiota bacterium]|jgi:hypothetical protein|nr:hypothetical protein [Verrucomicrobiota bacterium]OQB91235.1 MAG: hypothetical protein BWX84_01482 [Verrucomicrobia bacterium ADurb.Bin118]HPY31464.1 hypothetical protein [Verrucomicrobiota bacterium]HQB17753.1 hypothetical protein [Verrucomicrobiota bacterium]
MNLRRIRRWLPALWLLVAGCATVPSDFRSVWTDVTPPPTGLPAPAGFAVTPAEAYAVVFDSRRLSLKHVWHIYADSHDYYVHDAFLGASPRRAFTQGVRVDGRTAEVVPR